MSEPKLSDLCGLSAPLTKLVETISAGIGQLALPWQTKRMAKADAEAIQIISKALNEVNGEIVYKSHNFTLTFKDNISEYSVTNQIVDQITTRQDNIVDVVGRAANILETIETVSSDPVDKDWVVRFFSIVQDISNDELKNLWAKILAGEIEKPSSYSLRALDLLKNITQKEAKVVQKLYQFCVKSLSGEIYILGGSGFLKYVGISSSESYILKELNLAHEDSFLTFFEDQARRFLRANGKNEFRITKTADKTGRGYPIEKLNIGVPVAQLTTIGTEIFSLTYLEDSFDLSLLDLYLQKSQGENWLIEEPDYNLTNS